MWQFLTGFFFGGWLLSGSQARETRDDFGPSLPELLPSLPTSFAGKMLLCSLVGFFALKISAWTLGSGDPFMGAREELVHKMFYFGSRAMLFLAALSVLARPLSWALEGIGKGFIKMAKLTRRKANG